MKLKTSRIPATIILAASLAVGSFGASAYADVNNDGISGSIAGSPGTHLTNGSGKGNLAGYDFVRFDAYKPGTVLEKCDSDEITTKDRNILPTIGFPKSLDPDKTPFYKHYRVAVLRSDNVTVVGGVDSSPYWNSGEDLNVDTGERRATKDVNGGPTHDDPWLGPKWWSGKPVCLPLAGGDPLRARLGLVAPSLAVPKGRAVVGMKKATLTAKINMSRIDGDITLFFDLRGFWINVCKPEDAKAPMSPCKEGTTYNAEFDKGSPIIAKLNKTKSDLDNGVAVYDIKFKKKGTYKVVVNGLFLGNVVEAGALTEQGVLTRASDPQHIRVISIKSANRK